MSLSVTRLIEQSSSVRMSSARSTGQSFEKSLTTPNVISGIKTANISACRSKESERMASSSMPVNWNSITPVNKSRVFARSTARRSASVSTGLAISRPH